MCMVRTWRYRTKWRPRHDVSLRAVAPLFCGFPYFSMKRSWSDFCLGEHNSNKKCPKKMLTADFDTQVLDDGWHSYAYFNLNTRSTIQLIYTEHKRSTPLKSVYSICHSLHVTSHVYVIFAPKCERDGTQSNRHTRTNTGGKHTGV